MEKINKISVDQLCVHYSIETSFVYELDERGLIQLKRSGKQTYIAYEHLTDLEKYMRLHYDLEINMEGIEAINHLLSKIKNLQNELKKLQNES